MFNKDFINFLKDISYFSTIVFPSSETLNLYLILFPFIILINRCFDRSINLLLIRKNTRVPLFSFGGTLHVSLL